MGINNREIDEIVYELLPDNTLIVRKTHSLDLHYLRALNSTMSEWETEEEQDYKDL